MKPRLMCTRMMGRKSVEKERKGRSIPHHLSKHGEHGHARLKNGTESLVITVDVTADRSSRMNFKVYRAICSAQIQ